MLNIIIKCGVKKINIPDLRPSSNKTGEHLFKSNHVKKVEEWKYDNITLIKASPSKY